MGGGINIGYGTDVSKPFLGAKAHYDITDAFTVAASFNHYFKETVDLGKFGANLGIGGQLNLGSNWAVGVEAKYQIVDGGQFVPMASAMYRF